LSWAKQKNRAYIEKAKQPLLRTDMSFDYHMVPGIDRRGTVLSIWLRDFKRNLVIVGFGDVQIREPDRFFQDVKKEIGEICVQFFDASFVAGFDHLRFAAIDALNAFKSKASISDSLAVEILLYASAQRQIKEALNLVGIKDNTRNVVVLVVSRSAQQASSALEIVSRLIKGRRDDSLVDFVDDKISNLLRMFDISEVELEAETEQKRGRKQAIIDLIIEHMALLVTQR
jgi:tRNA threonylcarbamoyladenosine modification (KEOPS) complex Cgi121 subunit